VALIASLAVHAAVLAWIAPASGGTQTPQGPVGLSMIGQSFEDLAAGSISSSPTATRSIPPTAPDVVSPAVSTPSVSAAARPVVPATPISAPRPSPEPSVTARAAPRAAAPVPDAVTARDAPAAERPTEDTPRPLARPPRPEPAPPAPAAPPVQQGTAERDARAGTTGGTPSGSQTQRQGDAEAAPGPTAREIARYPQLVNRHLSRLRRPASQSSGTAVIAFSIAPDGGLASISVAQSSGNAGFDELALRHVQSAVPFPAPPVGAQTRYSVSVRGR
jgi:protein TonB